MGKLYEEQGSSDLKYGATETIPSTSTRSNDELPLPPTAPTELRIIREAEVKEVEWEHDLAQCGFCQCLSYSCCCPCYLYCLATRMDECGLVGISNVSCLCLGGNGFATLRSAFRKRHNIKGDIQNDLITTLLLLPCAACQ